MIKDCAGLSIATSAEDIWNKYTDQPMKKAGSKSRAKLNSNLTDQEKTIIRLIMMPQQFDELITRPELEISASSLAATLTILEIRGLVRQLPGKYYQAIVKNIS